MKKVLTKFLVLGGIGALMLTACKKDGALVTSNGGKAGALTASTTTPVLNKAALNDTTKVITFSFAKPNFGYSAAVTNTLQIDAAGDNWAKPMSATLSTNVYSQGYSTNDFNALLLKLNLPAGVASQVNVRIQSSLSNNVAPIYSNVLSLTVTPFNLAAWIYITGAFSGWANPGPAEDSLLSATGNGVYTGIINFNAIGAGNNQFLLLPVKGSWTNKYATTDNTTVSSTITYNAANNFNAPTANGQYIVTANLNANTISFAPADYYSIIGSAGLGWNPGDDIPMKYINDGTGTWLATNVPLIVGEYKFRQDDAWNNSWGPSATAGTIVSTGATGDGNIQLTTAGNYNLTFVMPATPFGTSTYTSLPTYNGVPFPFVSTTYTITP